MSFAKRSPRFVWLLAHTAVNSSLVEHTLCILTPNSSSLALSHSFFASMTSYHALGDVSSGDDSAVVLPPPMVCIPGGSSLREYGPSPFDAVSTPTTSVAEKRPMEEKIGRWTEEEHEIFLEGLQLHGKQWKTIATMIGTRTVVQVRTHAQKYFQKLERKNRDSNAIAVQGKKPSKRKSLPSAMPSRKKKLPKKTFPRSVSLSLPPLVPPVM